MPSLSEYDEELRTFVESLVRFDTTGCAEREAQEWLSAHPPTFERTAIQFAPAETDPDAVVVTALREAMAAEGGRADPVGETCGADSRHYIAAGIPTVVFGPGDIDEAYFPNETVDWAEVSTAGEMFVGVARRFPG